MDMDFTLKLLAPAGEHLSLAEEAVSESNWTMARISLDEADVVIEQMRGAYRDADKATRPLIAQLAAPLSARRDKVAAALPSRQTLSEGTAEPDPEEELEPEL